MIILFFTWKSIFVHDKLCNFVKCLFLNIVVFIGGAAANSDDSEKIRILSSATARSGKTNTFVDHQCSSLTETDISSSSVAGNHRKRTSANENNNEQNIRDVPTFYSGNFCMSPSDLDRSWKQRRSSMNGKIPGDGIRRTQSECKISIYRSPVDNSYIDQAYGIMPSQSTSQKV